MQANYQWPYASLAAVLRVLARARRGNRMVWLCSKAQAARYHARNATTQRLPTLAVR
jgi:hypothetical protein